MQAEISLPRVYSPSHERTTTILLMSLLALRLLLGFILMPFNTITLLRQYFYISYFFGTCLLTALLIWHERARLSTFHMSKLAVIFFVCAIPFQVIATQLGWMNSGKGMPLVLLPITLWLGVALLRVKDFRSPNPPHLVRNLLTAVPEGIIIGVIAGLLVSLQADHPTNRYTWINLLMLPFLQLGNAASQEEPLFRGFLWGWLEQRGWKGWWIWLFQAFLFWLGHIYYLGIEPYSLFVVVPLGGLVIGLVAWRSRDIAPSMVTHALMNTFGALIGGAG